MTDCSVFIKKWFDGADEKIATFKKSREQSWLMARYTLTSNNSQGNVVYATSNGISSFVGSVLYYSARIEGVNRQRAFTSIDIGTLKPIPSIACLLSNKRVDPRMIPRDKWAPDDNRQPFDIKQYSELFLSVSNHGDENIVVNGEIKKSFTVKAGKKIELIPRKFKFVAGCMNENILYGFSNSNAFLISFNGIVYLPSYGGGYYPGDKRSGKQQRQRRNLATI